MPGAGHRISDIGLGLLETACTNRSGKMRQSAPPPRGRAYINVFDGTTWLGDKQVLTIEGHIQTLTSLPYPGANTTKLFYDIDVNAALKSPSGLWLPPFIDNTRCGRVQRAGS